MTTATRDTDRAIRYLSVCSGVEAASVAWRPFGWEPVAFSEIADFPRAVLAHHYPQVTNLGSLTDWESWPALDGVVDVVVGGTPCQSFSVAGQRQGLRDPRGQLAFAYLALVATLRPTWVVWENVPGVLSSGAGRDFGAFLGQLADIGYGFCYRVLDAQFFGVPQRRRRVFVVGSLGDWRRAAAVLLDRESLQRDPPSSAETRQDVAGTLTARTSAGGGLGTDFDLSGGVVARCLTTKNTRLDAESESFVLDRRQDPVFARDLSLPLGAKDDGHCFVVDTTQITNLANRSNPTTGDPCHPLAATAHPPLLVQGARRLTPRECERLQGFPDDYTLIPYRGKPARDGPRYKALGNSMAVPVVRWIGARIESLRATP